MSSLFFTFFALFGTGFRDPFYRFSLIWQDLFLNIFFRAFDSLAPACSPFGLPVYVARLRSAPFRETPTLMEIGV